MRSSVFRGADWAKADPWAASSAAVKNAAAIDRCMTTMVAAAAGATLSGIRHLSRPYDYCRLRNSKHRLRIIRIAIMYIPFKPLQQVPGSTLGLVLVIGVAAALLAVRIAVGFADIGHPGL